MEQKTVSIVRLGADQQENREDIVAVEARFAVFVAGEAAFSFTCTPAHLEEMVVGALYSRGYIKTAEQVAELIVEGEKITVSLGVGSAPAAAGEMPEQAAAELFAAAESVFNDPDTLFNRTGCAHCCALFYQGGIVCVREDIGRHNALDKVIGFALRENIPLRNCAVLTSGRVSGDYMAKVIKAGLAAVVSRAAVTDAAINAAKENNILLYGFVRGGKANLYTD